MVNKLDIGVANNLQPGLSNFQTEIDIVETDRQLGLEAANFHKIFPPDKKARTGDSAELLHKERFTRDTGIRRVLPGVRGSGNLVGTKPQVNPKML